MPEKKNAVSYKDSFSCSDSGAVLEVKQSTKGEKRARYIKMDGSSSVFTTRVVNMGYQKRQWKFFIILKHQIISLLENIHKKTGKTKRHPDSAPKL